MSRKPRLSFRMRLGAVLLFCLLLDPVAAQASDDLLPADYADINKALITGHAIPRYVALAEKAGSFAGAVQGYCAADGGSADALEPARAAYQDLTDAWAGVAHIHFGPVELLMRGPRFYFWPQGRGKVAAAIANLEASAEPRPLTPERFRFASVAVQGLPAAAFLLYPNGTEQTPADHCALLSAIADNLAGIATALLSDWRDGANAFATVAMTPGPENIYFESHAEVTLNFLNALHTGLQSLADIELKPVLHDPQIAFLPPEGRELRTMQRVIDALSDLYLGAEGSRGLGALVERDGIDPALDPLMRKAFRMTSESADAIAMPLPQAVRDAATREKVEKLHTQITALRQIVGRRLARALDLQIGFNALDGD